MLLAIDIGNTNVTYGIFDGDKLIKKFRAPSNIFVSEYLPIIKENSNGFHITDCIIASVVTGMDEKFKILIDNEYKIQSTILSAKLPFNLTIKIDNPYELGADRIANALGVLAEFPEQNAIVIDFGTAITFDVINKNKEFIGGLIAPGLNMQLNSLCNQTSKLPLIELGLPEKIVATNTKDAILAGVVSGNTFMIEGLIKKYKEELAPENYIVIATGGISNFIGSYMKENFDYILPDLTLCGLKYAYKRLG